MLNAFGYLSCFKLCWHNWPGPRKIVKDEKKFHGAVDKSSSEQHFCESDAITFVV